MNKGENGGWFCSCPFDDSMMRARGQAKMEQKDKKEGKSGETKHRPLLRKLQKDHMNKLETCSKSICKKVSKTGKDG